MAWQIEGVPTDAERLEELKERIVWHPNNVFREGAPLAVVKAALLPHSLTETGRRELADLTQSFINQARLLSVSPDRLIGACALVLCDVLNHLWSSTEELRAFDEALKARSKIDRLFKFGATFVTGLMLGGVFMWLAMK